MTTLEELLAASAARHAHLCPRQVLGVRMGVLGGWFLALDVPRQDKRLLVILETDGCVVDGLTAATGCSVGHRTLRIEDLGKVAATFVDIQTEQAVRIAPRPDLRAHAVEYAPEATNRWQTYLLAYQRMPVEALLLAQPVQLVRPPAEIVSRPGARAMCQQCREEIINEREVTRNGRTLCRSCADGAYYRLLSGAQAAAV